MPPSGRRVQCRIKERKVEASLSIQYYFDDFLVSRSGCRAYQTPSVCIRLTDVMEILITTNVNWFKKESTLHAGANNTTKAWAIGIVR